MRDFHLPGRSPVLATQGACATSHPLAAKTAISILERGGNAMDAAIAGAVLLGICEPPMAGLGGDCFALFSPAGSDEILALNGSGRSAAKANAEDLRAKGFQNIPLYGQESVSIPGAVDAFCRLSGDHGKLGLEDILQPAIHYAETGVPVAPRVAFDWARSQGTLEGAARRYYLQDGKALGTGQVFKAPGQAEVLRRIAKSGRDAFYCGEVAEDMITTLAKLGGVHSAEDFANTECNYTTPVAGAYKAVSLVEHPPNGQGATAILLLNILKHFDLSKMDPFGTTRTHIETEAAKLAYDARNRFIADASFTQRLDYMLKPETAEKLAGLINPQKAMPSAAPVTEAVHKDTVYITVVDKDRMSVSLIYSIFHGFGSGVASEKFGILLQNRGAGFTLEQGHPNELAGGKRPMHTIIPGMLCEGGQPVMPFGVMGGAYQPTGHVRFLTNMVDYGMDPQTAIDGPRAFFDAGELRLERGHCDLVRQELAGMGHNVVTPLVPLGGAQAIRIHQNGMLEAASDPRKDGCALGY